MPAKQKRLRCMEFAPICVYLGISLLLSVILVGVSFLFAASAHCAYPEKLSAYECGFEGGLIVAYSVHCVSAGLEPRDI
jgi:NADH:ubiquinone oxidoreductase subunit 3 (subunit A)